MLSPTEKTLLKELLARAPVPELCLSCDELMGFMFGLAITPVHIPAEEWMVAVFGDDESGITALDQARSMSTVLGQVYDTFMAGKEQGDLTFPYELEVLEHCDLEEVLEWVSGFEEALALRPEIWEPGDDTEAAPGNIDELYFSMMIIQGLVDPVEIMPFFEKMPDEVLAEAFTNYDPAEENRDLQIQAFLLATLPLAVKTLQKHAGEVALTIPPEKRPKVKTSPRPPFAPLPSASTAKPRHRANIIQVDFSGRKKNE